MRAKGAVVAGLASLCVGCGSLLETKLPESTSYVLAPAPASSSSSGSSASACRRPCRVLHLL